MGSISGRINLGNVIFVNWFWTGRSNFGAVVIVHSHNTFLILKSVWLTGKIIFNKKYLKLYLKRIGSYYNINNQSLRLTSATIIN